MLPLIETRIMVVLVVMVVVVVNKDPAGRGKASCQAGNRFFFEVAVAIISIFVCIVEVPVRS